MIVVSRDPDQDVEDNTDEEIALYLKEVYDLELAFIEDHPDEGEILMFFEEPENYRSREIFEERGLYALTDYTGNESIDIGFEVDNDE